LIRGDSHSRSAHGTKRNARLSAADADTPPEGRDLEMMATAAYLIANDEAGETAWTRAYE
jgi:hypothetical protein